MVLGACGPAADGLDEPEVPGTVSIELKKVPTNVHCVQIVATGTRVLTSQFDVTPGMSASLTMPGVSPGSVTFSGAAFNGTCATVTSMTAPTWVADPVTKTISPGLSTTFTLSMRPAGTAVVGVDFALGISPMPTSGLVTSETGSTSTFTVVLLSAPTANVTVGLSSSDTTEGTVTPASLTFSPANWATPQTVTVKGVDDSVADGNVAYTIVTAPATSADTNYNGFNAPDVAATNLDNDVAGYVVASMGGITSEAGGHVTFTVALRSQPTALVTVPLFSTDTSEGTVTPASFAFTAANWNVPQVADVTGVNDSVADGDVAYAVQIGNAVSSDPSYSGRFAQTVPLTNLDDDVAGIIVGAGATTTTESGGAATFTIVLRSQPTANVTFALSSSDTTEGTVVPGAITFTAVNWNAPQTITVVGVDDSVADGNTPYVVTIANATSADPGYDGRFGQSVPFVNVDNDSAGVTVTPFAGLTTTEGGASATFSIVLTSQPTSVVSVSLSSTDTTEGVVSPATLLFTPVNWNAPQTVTITGVDDGVVDGNVPYVITTGPLMSADPSYNGLNPFDVAVVNLDND
jgi:hypothetical protein